MLKTSANLLKPIRGNKNRVFLGEILSKIKVLSKSLSLKSLLVVLFFSANWSDESKLMQTIVQELAKDEKHKQSVRFLEIEAEDYEQLSINYAVEAVPTFVFIKVTFCNM
jgi:hypothetical protein